MNFGAIVEGYAVTDEQYLNRINTCVACQHYIQKVSMCRRCACVMPLKARFKFTKCPERKWEVILPPKKQDVSSE